MLGARRPLNVIDHLLAAILIAWLLTKVMGTSA